MSGQRANGRPSVAIVVALLVGALVVVDPSPAAAAQPPQFVRAWGTVAATDADLRAPSGVAVSAAGEVFVLDTDRDAVQVYDRDGGYLRRWTVPTTASGVAVSPADGNVRVLRQCGVTEYTPAGAGVGSWGSCGTAAGTLPNSPTALAIAAGGDIYVADATNDRISRFTAAGTFVQAWGSSGTTDGRFRDPSAVAVGATGDVYVGDKTRDDVQQFTAAGSFVRKWGSTGSADGQFRSVTGLATGTDGSVYAADIDRVQQFDAAGAFVRTWGREGTLPGQFTDPDRITVQPLGVSVDPAGADVFVADSGNERVQRFSAGGVFEATWGTRLLPGRVQHPNGVAMDASGNVYVAEETADRIEVFAPDGTFLRQWAGADNADGRLLDPVGVAVGPSGDVYVADTGHDRVQRYAPDGQQLGSWGGTGTGQGQFRSPSWLGIDGGGHVHVLDAGNTRVQEFDAGGAFVRAWGSSGSANGQIRYPRGMAVDADGNAFVADVNSSGGDLRIQRFDAGGTFVVAWRLPDAPPGGGTSDTERADSVAVGPTGDVFVGDCRRDRVVQFTPTGTAVASWGTEGDGHLYCPAGLAVSAGNVHVADVYPDNEWPRLDRIVQFTYPTGPLARVTVSSDETDVVAGATIHYHVTVDNLGGVPLTGLTTTAGALVDCARSLSDIAVQDRATYDCTHQPAAADAGRFTATVTLHSNELGPVTSEPYAIDVAAFGAPIQVREWWASPTALLDGDPLGPSGNGALSTQDIAFTATTDGDVVVAGTRSYPDTVRVERFSSDGVFDGGWGAPGTAAGRVDAPSGVAVAPNGDVFVSECPLGRIQRFSATGEPIGLWLEERVPPNRSVCSPADVAVGPDGTAYVVDAWNERVDVISGDTYGPGWGGPGSGDGDFDDPAGIATAPDGSVYVLDAGNHRVQRFDSGGAFLGAWGTEGSGNGQFGDDATDLAVDASGRVFVADRRNGRIQMFSADGGFLAKWSERTGRLAVAEHADGSIHVYTYPESGSLSDATADGVVREWVFTAGPVAVVTLTPSVATAAVGATVQYRVDIANRGPAPLTGVTLDGEGLAGCTGPVADIAPGATRTTTCTFVPEVGDTGRHHQRVVVDGTEIAPVHSNNTGVEVLGARLAQFGSPGSGAGQFNAPKGVAVTWGGDLFVADCGNNRVQHLTTDGVFVDQWGTAGTGNGQFDCPVDVTVRGGDVLVLDRGNRRVQQFTRDGDFVRVWSTHTTAPGLPTSIDVDDDGNVYVVDSEAATEGEPCTIIDGIPYCTVIPPGGNNRVRRFGPDGTYLGDWGGYPVRYLLRGLWITSDGALLMGNGRFAGVEAATLTGTTRTIWPAGLMPSDLAVDVDGNVWTAESGSVSVRTGGGFLLAVYPVQGATGITVDQDSAYVTTSQGTVVKLGVPDPGVSVVVSADEARVAPGQLVHFHVTVANPGNQDLTGVVVSGGPAAGCQGPVANIGPASSRVVNCTYTATAGDVGVLSRSATVDTNETAPASSDPVEVVVDGAAIAGRVVEDGSGAPVAGAFVVALRPDTLGLVGGTVADTSGNYSLPVAAGDYLLEFADPSGGHRFEWYADQPNPADFSVLTRVAVTADQVTVADAGLARTGGDVAGTVTDSGGPVAGAYVVALRNGTPAGRATTNGAGQYRLAGLAPGSYTVVFVDPAAAHRPEFHADSATPDGATPVAVSAGGSTTVDAVLAANSPGPVAGSVSGVVSEDGSGAPVVGAMVVALRSSDLALVGATLTGGDGSYSFGVPAGSAYLEVADPSGHHRFEWFDDQPNPATFSVLAQVGPGSVANAGVAPTRGAIAGSVTETGSGAPISGAWVVATGTSGTTGVVTGPDGSYILGLAPGPYTVVVVDPSGHHQVEFHHDRHTPQTADPVTVTAAAITALDATLDPT